MKKLYTLAAVAMMSTAAFAQTTVNFVTANQGWTNGQLISSGKIDNNLTFTTTKNGATTASTFFTSDNTLRIYGSTTGLGNSFTITPSNGQTITAVTITSTTGYTPTINYSVNGGANVQATAATGTTTYTISGITAGTSFMFQNASTSSTQLRLASITVTYSPTSTLGVAGATASKDVLVKNTVVRDNIMFGAKSEVKIINANGQVVRQMAVDNGASIDVSALPKGIYIVSGTANGQVVNQKIIKN